MIFSQRHRLRSRWPTNVWWVIAMCAIFITAVVEWVRLPVNVYPGDEWLRDQFVKAHAVDTPETRLVMIDVDETSLAAIGPWPWPRTKIADVIEHLISNYGVRGISLDLFFPVAADVDGDARLAMLAQHGPVVMAQVFDYGHKPLRIGTLIGGTAVVDSLVKTNPVAVASGFIGNHSGLKHAARVGNIGFVPDADGVLRHLPPETLFEGRIYPTLSRALFDCCAATAHSRMQLLQPSRKIVNHAGFMRVPYHRSLSAFTIIKASDILNLTAPSEFLQDKLVIFGSSSLNLSDRVSTPLSPSTSGFLVHASALSALLDAQEGLQPSIWPGRWLSLMFTILVASLAAYTLPRLSALINISILGGASFLWLFLAFFIHPHDDFFSPTAPLMSNLFLLTVAVPYGWQVSQGKSHRLLGTLQQYVAKAVVDELLRSDLKDPLAPRQLHVTTLIADMEGYTTHVERLPVQEAAKLTRDFLECLTAPVLAMGGTLDKYTGDGLVAFWGAPLPIENHADLALDAGIQILQNIRLFNIERSRIGLRAIRVRIGVESGVAMAGDFGTSFRSIYTAVGDSVNVASRLEDVARDFPYDIIVGQGTVNSSTRHQFVYLGHRILRGKEQSSAIYTLSLPHAPETSA